MVLLSFFISLAFSTGPGTFQVCNKCVLIDSLQLSYLFQKADHISFPFSRDLYLLFHLSPFSGLTAALTKLIVEEEDGEQAGGTS